LGGLSHAQRSATNGAHAGHEVPEASEEDAAAEGSGQAAQEEVAMQHPAWALIVIGVLIASIGLVWLLAP
jgi:hypothetical protein